MVRQSYHKGLVAQICAFVWTVPHICPTLADVGFRLLVIFSRACLMVEKSEDWKWSSFRHYATAEIGPVEIESQWTADRRNGRTPKLLRIRAG